MSAKLKRELEAVIVSDIDAAAKTCAETLGQPMTMSGVVRAIEQSMATFPSGEFSVTLNNQGGGLPRITVRLAPHWMA